MKKAGIVTMQSLDNYGQKLQNYAVYHILDNCNYYPETIIAEFPKTIKLYKILNKMKRTLNPKRKAFKAKEKLFYDFREQYLRPVKYKYNDRMISENYDIVCTGSDQVWNPYLPDCELEFFLLKYINQDKIRCMAPSIGYDEIKKDKVEMYIKYINRYKYLSVREESGKNEIEALVNRECVRLVDPTMAIPVDVWATIMDEKYILPEQKYAFFFVIGDRDTTIFENYAKEYCLKHNLFFLDLKTLNDNPLTCVGPKEWLYLMRNAEAVFTNSFHGAVFSILFHKQFINWQREYSTPVRETRVVQLLKLFGLEGRMYNGGSVDDSEIDWLHIDDILEKECKEWRSWIRINL